MRHDFVTIADLPKEKLMYLLEMAKEFENHPNREDDRAPRHPSEDKRH